MKPGALNRLGGGSLPDEFCVGVLQACPVAAHAMVFDAGAAPIQDGIDRALIAVQELIPLLHVARQLAGLVEADERAQVLITEGSRRNPRHDIAVVDDSKCVGPQSEIEAAGEDIVSDSRLAKGIKSGHG